MTTVLLARHGETEWNREERYQGHADPPLNKTGRGQAEQLAEQLAQEPIEAVYASDLRRASETAEIVGARLGLRVDLEPGLREIDVERRSGWSVLGVGAAYEILDPARLSELADRLPTPWAPDRTGHCISIPLQRLTGRWLSPAG